MSGRELDAQVATEVMGWKIAHDPLEDRNFYCKPEDDPEWTDFDYYVDEWQPSTDIAAAMQVVDKMLEERYMSFVISKTPISYWGVEFHRMRDVFKGKADTLPLAICLAARAATEGGR